MREFNFYLSIIFDNVKFSKFKTIKPILNQLQEQYTYIKNNEQNLTYDNYLNINCNNCTDCIICCDCNNCIDCINCINCYNCTKSRDCNNCKYCDGSTELLNENGLYYEIFSIFIGFLILLMLILSPCLSCYYC
jgi:hypothetical protein